MYIYIYELASKIYAWSVFVSLLSVPYRFPWFWILQVCIHRGIVFCQSPIVFQGKSRKQHRDETSLTKVVDDNFEVASYIFGKHWIKNMLFPYHGHVLFVEMFFEILMMSVFCNVYEISMKYVAL